MHRASDVARRRQLHMSDFPVRLRHTPMQEGTGCLTLQFLLDARSPVDLRVSQEASQHGCRSILHVTTNVRLKRCASPHYFTPSTHHDSSAVSPLLRLVPGFGVASRFACRLEISQRGFSLLRSRSIIQTTGTNRRRQQQPLLDSPTLLDRASTAA